MYKTVERVRKIVVLKLLLWKPSHKRKEKYIFQGIRRALTYVHNSCEDILLCIRMLVFFNKERHRKPIFRRRTLLVGKYYHCVCVCVCVCVCACAGNWISGFWNIKLICAWQWVLGDACLPPLRVRPKVKGCWVWGLPVGVLSRE